MCNEKNGEPPKTVGESASLLRLVRAARVATVAQIQLTPIDELNQVHVKLQVCEQLLGDLPHPATTGV